MVKGKGLGRGLDSLLAGDVGSVGDADALRMIKISDLRPGKYQPRSYMDEESLSQLADSIKAQGIMQPILVRRLDGTSGHDEHYEIIAGERRWRASQKAGLTEVPVLVRDIADEAALAMALIENIQRENLNPLEEALGIKRLIDEFAMTHEKAATAVGRSRTAVTNLLRLLTLAVPVQDMLMQGKLDMGHARALIGLDAAKQIMLAQKIALDNLSVREVEHLVKQQATVATKPISKPQTVDKDVQRIEEDLSDKLGASVKIQAKSNGSGALKIEYSSLDQLDEIIAKLAR